MGDSLRAAAEREEEDAANRRPQPKNTRIPEPKSPEDNLKSDERSTKALYDIIRILNDLSGKDRVRVLRWIKSRFFDAWRNV